MLVEQPLKSQIAPHQKVPREITIFSDENVRVNCITREDRFRKCKVFVTNVVGDTKMTLTVLRRGTNERVVTTQMDPSQISGDSECNQTVYITNDDGVICLKFEHFLMADVMKVQRVSPSRVQLPRRMSLKSAVKDVNMAR